MMGIETSPPSADMLLDELETRLLRLSPAERRRIHQRGVDTLRASDAHLNGLPLMLPCVVPAEAQRDAALVVDKTVDLLVRLEELADREPHVRERLMASLDADTRRFAELNVRESSRRRRNRRPDGHVVDGKFVLFEVNQIAPQSGIYEDAMQRMARALLDSVGLDYDFQTNVEQFVDWLFREHVRRNRRLPRVVTLVSESGVPRSRAYRALRQACERHAFEAYGEHVAFFHCYPHELSRNGSQARAHGYDVDVVWMHYLDMSVLRKHGYDDGPLVDVLLHATNAVIVNAPRSAMTGTKAALAMLWDAEVQRALALTEEDLAFLRRAIPRTVDLGSTPSAREEILSERERWLTKPSDTCQAIGAVIGATCDENAWRKLVDERANSAFVFQHYIAPSEMRTIELTDFGELVSGTAEYVYSPVVVDGRWRGAGNVRAHVIADIGRQKIIGPGSGLCTPPMLQMPRGMRSHEAS